MFPDASTAARCNFSLQRDHTPTWKVSEIDSIDDNNHFAMHQKWIFPKERWHQPEGIVRRNRMYWFFFRFLTPASMHPLNICSSGCNIIVHSRSEVLISTQTIAVTRVLTGVLWFTVHWWYTLWVIILLSSYAWYVPMTYGRSYYIWNCFYATTKTEMSPSRALLVWLTVPSLTHCSRGTLCDFKAKKWHSTVHLSSVIKCKRGALWTAVCFFELVEHVVCRSAPHVPVCILIDWNGPAHCTGEYVISVHCTFTFQ